MHKTQDEDKQNKNTIHFVCVGDHHKQAYTNNVNKIWDFLQITGGQDEPNIVTDITAWNLESKDT